MTYGERVKEVRKLRELTLEKFGEKLGVGKTAISNIENGNRNLTGQMIKAICREFNVNESWLRTGEGGSENMFKKEYLENEYTAYAMEIGNGASDMMKKVIIKYGRLSPQDRKIIDDALELAYKMIKEE